MDRMYRLKRVVFRAGLVTFGLAAAQGVYLRGKFAQVDAPLGAHTGHESWMENVRRELQQKKEACAHKLMERVSLIIDTKPPLPKFPSHAEGPSTAESNQSPPVLPPRVSWTSRVRSLFSSMLHRTRGGESTTDKDAPTSSRRKIRLILLGDSLVCGFGCERELVLPNVIAKSLSLALQADVSWRAQGFNGATSLQLMALLPDISEDLRSHSGGDEEVLVVVICGLNDWKSVLLEFPFGSGPVQFKKNLDALLSEIRALSGGACRVFLPALPMVCQDHDPKAMYVLGLLAFLSRV